MRQWAYNKGGHKANPDGFDRGDPGTLASLIDEWFRWLEERNYSPHGNESRKWALRTFLHWTQEQGLRHPEQIQRNILESYQSWLYLYRKEDGQPLSVWTQCSRLNAIQCFFAWLCKKKILSANPAADLELPRPLHRSLPKALTIEEVNMVLNIPDITDPLGIRDRAILETFYATGIRRRELIQLELEDLDHERGILLIRRGKGGKDRVVPLGESALHWILRYLEKTRPVLDFNMNQRTLFLTGYGERFSPGYIGTLVRETLRKARIFREGSCHLFRHSCATHMLENGADIRYIQQLLGHAYLNTTQIYTEVDIRQLHEVHSRTHPLARIFHH